MLEEMAASHPPARCQLGTGSVDREKFRRSQCQNGGYRRSQGRKPRAPRGCLRTEVDATADGRATTVVSPASKSVLAVGAPRRYRNREHVRFVAQRPCLLCGRKPTDSHPPAARVRPQGERRIYSAALSNSFFADYNPINVMDCLVGRARKPRSLGAATDGPLGRSALPTPAASRLPPKLASGADAAATTPAAVKSPGQSNPALKKARKTTGSQNSGHEVRKIKSSERGRDDRGRDDRWSARAYAMPDSPGLFERSWGWSR